MKTPILVFAFLFTVCSYAQQPDSRSSAQQNAEACVSTHGESFATLREANGLVGVPSMYETEGEVPRMLSALRCLVEDPDAVAELVRLLEEGSVAGQLYALIGLKVLDPGEFARRIPPYLSRPGKVELLGGDVSGMDDVSDVSAHIAEGLYSVLMPASKYSPVKPCITIVVPDSNAPAEFECL